MHNCTEHCWVTWHVLCIYVHKLLPNCFPNRCVHSHSSQSHLSVSFETSSFKIFSSPNFRAVQMCWETVVWQKQPGTERSFSLCGSGALPIPRSRIHMNMLPLPWTPVSLCLNCRHGAKLSLKFLPTLTFCSLDMKK